MEDMARLALVEHNIQDFNKFYLVLQELLSFTKEILEHPYDYEFRIIESDVLREYFSCEAFTDYLKYIGLQLIQNEYIYPSEQTMSRLWMSQAAIERKLSLCTGPRRSNKLPSLIVIKTGKKRKPLNPSFIEINLHPMLVEMRTKFNDMLKYENDDLLQTAREEIPILALQSMAMERMREQEKERETKADESENTELSFGIALLMELAFWFKYKYFSWVDKPSCEKCDGPTQFICASKTNGPDETYMVETYKCTACSHGTRFPRYNNPATLMRTRRGRCGEWANCFTLFCRALGYDTRFVYDDQDHVWCEVFDYDSFSWVHVDPCEGTLNTPLMYSHGWKKTLSYVFAFSKDDLQDVTWRYTMDHKEVRRRRTALSERLLLDTLVALRAHRHAQLPPARRRHLAERTLAELADLMHERKPSDEESYGRKSGSLEWRMRRKEISTIQNGHTFYFDEQGQYVVRYHASQDMYQINALGDDVDSISTWQNGVYECDNIFRKVEMDWRQVYLAREEGELTGSISWAFAVKKQNLVYKSVSIKLKTQLYETGSIEWTIQFDDEPRMPIQIDDLLTIFSREFSRCVLRARLAGGRGDTAWQHAQLFRTPLGSPDHNFQVRLYLDKPTGTRVRGAEKTETSYLYYGFNMDK